MEERIWERDLLLPALKIINDAWSDWISTPELSNSLRELLNPSGEDLKILNWRADDKFSQKVRNLKSHKTLEKKGLVRYENSKFYITEEWIQYLQENNSILNQEINEEIFSSWVSYLVPEYYEEFKKSIEILQNLCDLWDNGAPTQENIAALYRLLYWAVIISLETYLYEALRFNVFDTNDGKIKKFVENFQDFSKKKIIYKDIFSEYEQIWETVDQKLHELLYHNLPKIKCIYKDTFNIDFPDIWSLMKAIKKRHDIFHRNWKDPRWQLIDINSADINNLISEVKSFVNQIEQQFNS